MRHLYIQRRSVVLWSIFVVLLFLAGFRWDVGIDWKTYMGIGENESSISDQSRLELGTLLARAWLHGAGYSDGGYYIWIIAAITLFLFFYSFRRSSADPVFSAVLFICMGPFLDSLNGVRQFAAIAFFVFSWVFIFRRQPVRYVLTILTGTLFHTSVLAMLPVYWLVTARWNKSLLTTLCLVFIPLSFVSDRLVPLLMSLIPQYEVYETMSFSSGGSNVMSLLRMVFPLIMFFIIMRVYDRLSIERETRVLCNLSIVYVLLTMLFPTVTLMIRMAFYFQMSLLFLIPVLYRYMNAANALFFRWFCVVYGFCFLYFTQLRNPVANILPFELDFRLADGRLLWLLTLVLCCTGVFIFLTERLFRRKKRA